MLVKKQPPPIRTYKTFFKALRLCREKYKFDFSFVTTNDEFWDEHGYAHSHTIWHRQQSTAFLNPIEVVYYVFYSPSTKFVGVGSMVREGIGLPQDKYDELVMAYQDSRGHLISLRQRMCKALKLVDVPINERPSYRTIEDMHKRRT